MQELKRASKKSHEFKTVRCNSTAFEIHFVVSSSSSSSIHFSYLFLSVSFISFTAQYDLLQLRSVCTYTIHTYVCELIYK